VLSFEVSFCDIIFRLIFTPDYF